MSNATHKSIAQLKKEAIVAYEPNHFSIKQWLNSTNKILDAAKFAKEINENNANETIYVNNIRATSILLEIIPKHRDYHHEIHNRVGSTYSDFFKLRNT
ncbi:11280_t:CDS:2 [Funneliformis mosseae]|uniref:11280_t:CDS:1 n=1 Tax=Funneliformis mosseae TaxID=27381 RepID=A0A9N8Z5A8_FUNMO|nr:11280_t:CDS:2 [Funneliformis mosseae]